MNILAEIWNEWATKERIEKAGKQVGIAKDGLNVNWMDQSKFEQAESILSPPTPTKSFASLPEVKTPEGVRKFSARYWKELYQQRTEQVKGTLQEDFQLETVEGLLPFKKVKPKETVRRKITDCHGSLKATNVRALIEKKETEEKEREENKEKLRLQKEETKLKFTRCLEACVCNAKICEAFDLSQCSECKNVQKSQCSKKACKKGGEAPVMIQVAAKKEKRKGRLRKMNDGLEESEESDEDVEDLESESDGESEGEFSAMEEDGDRETPTGMEAIKAVQERLDDDQNGQFFAVYFDNAFYWGKSLRVSCILE